jgi:hypothetical protein
MLQGLKRKNDFEIPEAKRLRATLRIIETRRKYETSIYTYEDINGNKREVKNHKIWQSIRYKGFKNFEPWILIETTNDILYDSNGFNPETSEQINYNILNIHTKTM